MGRKKIGAPQYTDIPDEHYLVIINPWGMVSGRPRQMRDIQCCAAWLRGVFGVEIQGLVEAIYVMDTRDEVIVRLAPEADHELGLGVHKPEKFLEPEYLEAVRNNQAMRKYRHIFTLEYLASMNSRSVMNPTYIFEYNWTRHGDPLRKQWKAMYPPTNAPPKEFPVKIPYPDASWSAFPPQCSDQRLSSMLLKLPESRVRTPTPPPPSPPPEPAPELDTSLFAPYVPPAHHPSHVQSHYAAPGNREPQSRTNVKADSEAQSGSAPSRVKAEPSKSDKLDPYEQDEAARRGLNNQSSSVKKEEPLDDRKPSRALMNAFNEYHVRHAGPSRTSEISQIKGESGIDVKPDISASHVLRDAYEQFARSAGSSQAGEHIGTPPSVATTLGSKRKPQHEDDHRGWKRTKDEPFH